MTELTQLLVRWNDGDREAQEAIFSRLFTEMRRISSSLVAREGAVSISADDLLNEGALRLIRIDDMDWQSRAHFLAMAARIMRRVLVDHARARRANKRAHQPVTLVTGIAGAPQALLDIDRLEKALLRLNQIDPARAGIVELRYFGGLSLEEIAEVTEQSVSTVKRSWRSARVWLQMAMEEDISLGD